MAGAIQDMDVTYAVASYTSVPTPKKQLLLETYQALKDDQSPIRHALNNIVHALHHHQNTKVATFVEEIFKASIAGKTERPIDARNAAFLMLDTLRVLIMHTGAPPSPLTVGQANDTSTTLQYSPHNIGIQGTQTVCEPSTFILKDASAAALLRALNSTDLWGHDPHHLALGTYSLTANSHTRLHTSYQEKISVKAHHEDTETYLEKIAKQELLSLAKKGVTSITMEAFTRHMLIAPQHYYELTGPLENGKNLLQS